MNESILTTIRKLLTGSDYDSFDTDLIIHINSVLMILCQMGVGPEKGFVITGPNETWNDFIPEASLVELEGVKTYIYQKVRLIFDPPQSSTHIQAINESIKEFEWRLYTQSGNY